MKKHGPFLFAPFKPCRGFPGRGYVPISRMNGGYGNRPRVGLSLEPTHGARFTRDIKLMMNMWGELVERGFSDHGVGLVWLLPWDGAAKLPLSKLAPHFIEVCSRARLVQTRDERFECMRATASSRRCAPEIQGGDVGDPWIPVNRDGRVLTVARRGYHYGLLVKILFETEFSTRARPKRYMRRILTGVSSGRRRSHVAKARPKGSMSVFFH